MPLRHLTALLLLVAPLGAQADVRLPALFSNHMVLQRETQAQIWGWAEPGQAVTVAGSWNGTTVQTVADADGRWSVALATGPAGGPYELTVNELVRTNVMLGEVWICSGQSNMEWNVGFSDDAKQTILASEHTNLRLFSVRQALGAEPAEDVLGGWAPSMPKSVARFSAVAYHFGLELLGELGDVPIGLINTSWGGTPSEAWTSAEGLAAFVEFADDVAALAHIDDAPSLEQLQASWWEHLVEVDPGHTENWMGARVDGASWGPAQLPGTFRELGLGDVDGCVWFRRVVNIPEEWVGKPLVLDLGPVDDMDVTFLNGQQIGATQVGGRWQSPRSYEIAADVAQAGPNVLAVCAVDMAGLGSVGKAGKVSSKMLLRLASQKAGEGLSLVGSWQVRVGAQISELGNFPHQGILHSNYPTALYNAMIAPLTPFAIRGAIWYQGESNHARAAQYRRLFPALISDWRAQWGQGDFPFYYVQIAPFAYQDDQGQAAELREAQTLALSMPNTGMAVTMDIGDPADIHPTNKRDVGLRLARWALAHDYGQDVVFSGPLYRGMETVGREVRLSFEHGAGLTSGDAPPSHFTVAGDDQVFHPGRARIEGSTVVVSSDFVPAPAAVRYAWGAADEPNLANGAGLPAPSFRTDDWPMVSRER